MSKFALKTFPKANNLGDEIQELAARQFLPKVDCFVDRDNLDKEIRELRVIGNAYWEFDSFPKDNVDMLPIAMHIANRELNLDWFRANQPIGCRDENTARFLRSNGIYAYFSGCLTLTFPKYEGERNDTVLLVGSRDSFKDIYIPDGVNVDYAHSINNIKDEDINNPIKRMEQAEEWLDILRKSKLVISSRVHVIFPCIAMGTPVIPIQTQINADRLSGYELPVREDNFIIDKIDFNKDYTIPRPEEMINDLKRRIKKWVN